MKRFTDKEISFIKENYKTETYKEIAKYLNRTTDVVKQKVRLLGLSSCKIGTNPKSRKKKQYTFNENFFSKQTLISSYWAGFFSADGYINDKRYTNELSCMLSIKDKKHLEKFKKEINFDGPILLGNCNGFPMCSITLRSNKLCQDLKDNFNIIPRKSLKLKFPRFNFNENRYSFIIGYIDGDGSIFKVKKKLRFTILGTKSFLKTIVRHLRFICNKTKYSLYKKNNIYDLTFSSYNAEEVYEYLDTYDVPKLKRKWKY